MCCRRKWSDKKESVDSELGMSECSACLFARVARVGGTRELVKYLERVTGIEPAWPAWKAGTLPLSYTRKGGLTSLNQSNYSMQTFDGRGDRI